MEQNHTQMNGFAKSAYDLGRALPQKNLFEIMLRSRWIILASIVLCLCAAYIHLKKSTPIFQSTSRIYVEPRGPKIMTDSEGIMAQSKNYLYTQSELIRSTPIMAEVINDPMIARLQTFSGKSSGTSRSGGADILFDQMKVKPAEPSDKPDDGVIDNRVLFLKKNLSVSVGKKDDIIAVSFDSPYPKDAAQIVNAVVGAYIKYHASQKQDTASEVLKILYSEKERRDAELKANREAMLVFTREHGVFSAASNDQNVVLQRLSKLSSALTDAQLETIRAKAQYNVVLSMGDDPQQIKRFAMEQANSGVQVFVEDVETQLRAEKRALEIEYKGMQEYCTADHPALQALQDKIQKITRQLEEEAQNFAETYLEVARVKLDTARTREEELQVSYDAQEEAGRDLTVQAAEYHVLDSTLKRTEKLCEALDDRIREINVNVTEDGGKALNINILETARPAISPYKPDGRRMLAKALMLGLALGCGLAFLRDLLDSRLRSADEIAAVLNLPIVGIVPMMSSKLSVPERGQQVYQDSKSHVAESFRTIRTALFFGLPKGKGQILLLTSPTPGDGKSSMASNLGIAMAQSGQTTLILDGDLRKPMQHKIFDTDPKVQGLSAVIAGHSTLKEAIFEGPVKGLDILPCPCGTAVPNPSEMLSSTAFSEIVNALRQQYDRIIIDSPPVTAVTDSHILAAMSDSTLLVIKAESATKRLSQQARDTLLSVGANLYGVIVNGVSKNQGRYGYYSYKYYGTDQEKKEQPS
jgi:capsular exopolysaccharide synthesis family protein